MIALEALNIHTRNSCQRSAFTYRGRQYMTTPNEILYIVNPEEGSLN